MAQTKIENTSNTANHTFDTNKIEIDSGKYQLKPVDNPGQHFIQSFDNDTGFTYDNTKSEFTGGLVRQKDLTPSTSVMAGKFDDKDLTWNKEGTTVGNLQGSPVFSSGKVTCLGAQSVYYNYTTKTTETHKFQYIPTTVTAPAVNSSIVGGWNGTNDNDRWQFMTTSSSNIRFTMWNSVGGVVSALTPISNLVAVAGQSFEVEVSIDSILGKIRIAVDGVVTTATVTPWTRGTSSSRVYLGAFPPVYNTSDAGYDNYIMFSDIQHTANYTPGYSILDYRYTETKVDLPFFIYSGVGNVQSVDSSIVTESGDPHYIVGLQYWDGAAWVPSDGSYAQSNTSAVTIANLPAIDVGDSGVLPASVVFGESNDLSSVDYLDIEVTGQTYPSDDPYIKLEAVALNDLLTFVDVQSATGSDAVKYLISLDGAFMNWDGAAWVSSTLGYANTNTATEINDNAGSLVDDEIGVFDVYVYLHSNTGGTTPLFTSLTYTYEFFKSISAPSECLVYTKAIKTDGEPDALAKISVDIVSDPIYHGDNVLTISSEASASSTGFLKISIIETETIGEELKITLTMGDGSIKEYTALIPNESTKSLREVVS